MKYLYILATVLLTVYGQLVIKWQMNLAGPMPTASLDKVAFLLQQLLNPWIVSALAAAFGAALAWMAAMSAFPLSYAYPFMSAAFVLVLVLSALLLQEPMTWPKIAGVVLIAAGLAVSSQG
jgi:multidrug transporter EmrE-like cation transporter